MTGIFRMARFERCARLLPLFALVFLAAIFSASCACAFTDSFDVASRRFGTLSDGSKTGTGTVTPPFGTLVAFRSITVKVIVRDGTVDEIEITDPAELAKDERFESLCRKIVRKGSLDVDVVSGATWSSRACLKAVEKAVFN